MTAYLIVEHTITDPAKFQEYGNKVRPLVEKYGGRSLARGSHRVLAEVRREAATAPMAFLPPRRALMRWNWAWK